MGRIMDKAIAKREAWEHNIMLKQCLRCSQCGEPFIEVKDKIAGKKTGHQFRYACNCVPRNIRVSIG